MKLKKFLLPLLVVPLFLASCNSETKTVSKLSDERPEILNYYDSNEITWSVNTKTKEIFKNGVLYTKFEEFSETLWYSKHTLFHVTETGILIENFHNEGNVIILTLIPEPEEETTEDEETSGTESELYN